jgi:hypothetical protein
MPARSFWTSPALLLMLLTGCATFRLSGTWQNPNVASPHYSKVVVLATARETTSRRIFEDTFVGIAQSKGVQAIQGYNVVQERQDLTEQELETGIRNSGSQAAIVVSVNRSTVVTQGGPTYTDPYGGPDWQVGYWGYYSTGWMEWSATSTVTTVMVQLRLNVYDAVSKQLVWSAITNSVAQDQVSNQAVPLAQTLFDGLWSRAILVPAPHQGLAPTAAHP